MKKFYFIAFFTLSFFVLQQSNAQIRQTVTLPLSVETEVVSETFSGEIYSGNRKKFKGIPYNLKKRQSQISEVDINGEILHVLYGKVSKHVHICIIDANRDGDFSNDKLYQFNSDESDNILLETQLIELPGKDKRVKNRVYIRPVFPKNQTANGRKLKRAERYRVDLGASLLLSGEFTHYGDPITVFVQKDIQNIPNNYTYAAAAGKNLPKSEIFAFPFISRIDSVTIGQYLMEPTFINAEKTTIDLRITDIVRLHAAKKTGITEGFVAPQFRTRDMNGMPVRKSNFAGKYLLLDFWGTWSVESLEGRTFLLELKKEFPELNIVSVAFELEEKSIMKMPELIRKYEMNWVHLYELMQQPGEFLSYIFNVAKYPTAILIDPDGVIIFRGGADENDRLENLLMQRLKS